MVSRINNAAISARMRNENRRSCDRLTADSINRAKCYGVSLLQPQLDRSFRSFESLERRSCII